MMRTRAGAKLLTNTFLLLFSCLILAPIAGELFLRAGIARGFELVRRPELYADLMNDADYWVLENRWPGIYPFPDKLAVHLRRGWTQEQPTPANPMGLFPSVRKRLVNNGRGKILFYGDSFVQGIVPAGSGLPDLIEGRLKNWDALLLGIGGYGTDQIFLLFQETYWKVEKPVILMGVFMEDIDRAMLDYRVGQKPYFVFNKQGAMELKGAPVEMDQINYLKKRPLKFRSYFFRLLAKKAGWYRPELQKNDLKVRLNRAFVEETQKICREKNLPLLYVLFYHYQAFKEGPPEPGFLEEHLAKLNIPAVNTGQLIWEDLHRRGGRLEDYYDENGGHHNLLGNQVISEGIVKQLFELGMVPKEAAIAA